MFCKAVFILYIVGNEPTPLQHMFYILQVYFYFCVNFVCFFIDFMVCPCIMHTNIFKCTMRRFFSLILVCFIGSVSLWISSASAFSFADLRHIIAIGDGSLSGTDNNGQTNGSQEQTMQAINQFLIDSYKTHVDKILADLLNNIHSLSSTDQVKVLQQMSDAVEKKTQFIMSLTTLSENRKSILIQVFSYIHSSINTDIQKIQNPGSVSA